MEERAPAIVTLTTDFGLQDPYAGQLRGAVLRGCPWATVVDLTHGVPPWDVVTAAVTIRTSFRFFPAGSVHVVVVDPGVGSRRPILAASGSGHLFVAPDNGILSLLVVDSKLDAVHRVAHPDFTPTTASPTLHGRDRMAPVAAALAAGRPLADLGPEVDPAELTMVIVPASVHGDNCLLGQVQRIDHFGNVRTTIRTGLFDPPRFAWAEIEGHRVERLHRTYAEAPAGALLALVDSSGYLEIAANQANAAEQLGCRPGDPVTVHLTRA